MNLRLLPIEGDLAESLRAGSQRFRQQYGVSVAAEDASVVRDVVQQTLDMLAPGPTMPAGAVTWRWTSYLVDSCAFKGPPSEDDTAEVAYYKFGPCEGRGYVKGMARR